MGKHIVVSAFSARRGGGKTYLRNLFLYLPTDIDIKVTVLAYKGLDFIKERENITIDCIKIPVENPIIRVLWEMTVLPFYLRRINTDVFFCPGGVIPKLGFGPWKTVTMFRNMIPFDLEQRKKYPLGYMRLRNWLLEKIMLRSMEKANLVIFISKYAKQVVEDISKNGIKKAVTIPHGVSDDFRNVISTAELRPSYFPKYNYIVYPSIIDVYKSQKEVVSAVAILRDQGVNMPVLLMVGEVYGSYGEEVRDLIRDLGLQQQVIIFGAVKYKDMPLLYHFADFVIFASKSENCPNILLEALASSSAILCSDKMPMPEFAGDAVKYIDPASTKDMASAMNTLLLNHKKVEMLRKKAYAQSRKYQWIDTVNETWKEVVSI